jgi:hypothetical protein
MQATWTLVRLPQQAPQLLQLLQLLRLQLQLLQLLRPQLQLQLLQLQLLQLQLQLQLQLVNRVQMPQLSAGLTVISYMATKRATIGDGELMTYMAPVQTFIPTLAVVNVILQVFIHAPKRRLTRGKLYPAPLSPTYQAHRLRNR